MGRKSEIRIPKSEIHFPRLRLESEMWEAPQCADSGEPLIERPLQLGRKSEIRNPKSVRASKP